MTPQHSHDPIGRSRLAEVHRPPVGTLAGVVRYANLRACFTRGSTLDWLTRSRNPQSKSRWRQPTPDTINQLEVLDSLELAEGLEPPTRSLQNCRSTD